MNTLVFSRIRALVRKELLTLLRDPRGRFVLIGPPLMQLIIFAFAATMEVKNNTLAIFNEDSGAASAELVSRFTRIGAFSDLNYSFSEAELADQIEGQKALVALHIPTDFSARLRRGESAVLQAIVDGRRSNSGQIALGYLNRIVSSFSLEHSPTHQPGVSEIMVRHWFNSNLTYLWFTIPGLLVLLTTLVTMVVTALSVARERELGTFDQLLVSPLSPGMILAGKMLPAFIVAMLEGTLILIVGVLLYGVPFRGSLALLFLVQSVYILSLVGIGLFVSALCKTQQQAILGVFCFMLPAILLSGYASPIDNMPPWLQTATLSNPLRHFFTIAKGIFLKDIDASLIWQSTWPMLIIAVFTLSAANWLFRHKLD